jgi:hypothetical protein
MAAAPQTHLADGGAEVLFTDGSIVEAGEEAKQEAVH